VAGPGGGPIQLAAVDMSVWTDEELAEAIRLRKKLDAGRPES
jgi:hypothetical protein